MNWRYRLLHIDSTAGLTVGVAVLLLSHWLAAWYNFPQSFVYVHALANLAYGAYSFSLRRRKQRPMPLIILLATANLIWAVLCLYWIFMFSQRASIFGLTHLLLEAIFVGGLGILEWRYRQFLVADILE